MFDVNQHKSNHESHPAAHYQPLNPAQRVPERRPLNQAEQSAESTTQYGAHVAAESNA